MKTFNITAATTAELVAFHNQHAAEPVKKTSDRKTAERRCTALVDAMPKKASRKATITGTVTRSEAISRSWVDSRVAAARAARHHVIVNKVHHKSLSAAVRALGLEVDISRVIAAREVLVAEGRVEIAGYTFKLAE